jgi:hypothetical protein
MAAEKKALTAAYKKSGVPMPETSTMNVSPLGGGAAQPGA